MRLDQYLVEEGLQVIQKPAYDVSCDQMVHLTGTPYTYVSRGGVKLEAALDEFGITPAGMCALDIGASSGGFTDCLLRRGAVRVYAVDSGAGQMDPTLVRDPRVINMERCNARALTPADIGAECALCVMDVSFISQKLILPVLPPLLSGGGILISLIKPQFECGRSGLSKNGIVKDWRVRRDAVRGVVEAAAAVDLAPVGLMRPPVSGGDGNIEFLLCCRLGGIKSVDEQRILEVCRQ